MKPNQPFRKESIANRRTVLTGMAGTLAGASGLYLATTNRENTVIAAGVHSLEISDGHAELSGEPDEIILDVQGTWSVDSTIEDIDRVDTTLLVIKNGTTRELDVDVLFDPASVATHDFAVSGDILEHPEITAAGFDGGAGTETQKELTVGIVVSVIVDNSIVAEESVYADVPLTVGQEGDTTEIGIEATGEIEIN